MPLQVYHRARRPAALRGGDDVCGPMRGEVHEHDDEGEREAPGDHDSNGAAERGRRAKIGKLLVLIARAVLSSFMFSLLCSVSNVCE